MSKKQDLGPKAEKIELERRLDANAGVSTKSKSIKGRRIAILATDGFEQSELMDPKKIFEEAGADVDVLAPEKTQKSAEIRGWKNKDWGASVDVDLKVGDAKPDDYDALVLPGGVINPDNLRLDEKSVSFIKKFASSGKTIAAICHGPLTLINAELVEDRKLTSWPSISVDLKNAGAHWADREVVIDGQLITSRKPDDIPAFSNAVIDAVARAASA
jgi:protease I